MSKYEELKKKIIKDVAIAGALVLVGVGGMFGVGQMATSALQEQTDAENILRSKQSNLSLLNAQIERSGNAKKRYQEIRQMRPYERYDVSTEGLKNSIREIKDQYRLSNIKLTLGNEEKSMQPEFSTLNHDIMLRKEMVVSFGAISDLHVFSMLGDFMHNSPGVIRITKLDLTRKAALDNNALVQMNNDATPELVGAELHFLWAGVAAKTNDGGAQ